MNACWTTTYTLTIMICQISSKSVERLQGYGHLTVFKMVYVRRLQFLKFKFLTVGAVKTSILRRYRDFVTFKMAAAVILYFQKIEILTVDPV